MREALKAGGLPDGVQDDATLNEFYASDTSDQWGWSLQELQQKMEPLIREWVVPVLRQGGRVYESAVGSGRMVRIIDKALQQAGAIGMLEYHGNDINPVSIANARSVINGSFCLADSLDLRCLTSSGRVARRGCSSGKQCGS